jgi:transposase
MKVKNSKKEPASITIREFMARFSTDEICLEHLFEVRFGKDHPCPACTRQTKWFRIKAERAYSCQFCGHHLHPTAGTLFEDTRTPLQLWFYAFYLFTTSRHGVPAKELERQLGVGYKTAWRMAHLIRQHMEMVDGEFPLSGDVEIDETYIGGKHTSSVRYRSKTAVLGMLQRDGEIMTKVIPNSKGSTLLPIIEENVAKGSTCHTDEANGYRSLKNRGYGHQSVQHNIKEYVKGNSHVNGLENFWKHLKGGINGTHIHVSKKHMHKYTKEFEFRFNHRSNPSEMFPALVSTFQKPQP